MDKFDNSLQLAEGRSSLGSAIVLLLLAFIGSIVGSFLGLIIAIPLYPGSFMEMNEAIMHPLGDPGVKIPLYVSQGVATILGMIMIPLIYLKTREEKSFMAFFKKDLSLWPIALTFLIVLAFMMVNSLFIEWNANFVFPDFMSGFEAWARNKEDQLAVVTEYLTNFRNSKELLLAFVVIAILAPIGEELLFRGFLQNFLHKGLGNVHLAIWVAAIIFSAIHLQFFGFIPRLLLGALFGYLYYWSGNLFVPIVAHFVNNGFTLLLVFLNQRELLNFDIENTETLPLPAVLIFAIITGGLLFYFRKFFLKQAVTTNDRMAKGV